MSDLNPGRYDAELVDYCISKTKDGEPQAALTFRFETTDGFKTMTWFGSFKPKAVKWTIETLVICGLRGDDVSVVCDGPDGDGLKLGTKVSCVLEEHEYNGKTTLRISWVNRAGGASNLPKFNVAEVKTRFADLKGEVMKARKELNINSPESEEDVPF